MHARESEILVKYLKRSEFIVSQVECSLDYHRVSGGSKYLAAKGRIPLGASTVVIICSRRKAIGLYISSVIVDLS